MDDLSVQLLNRWREGDQSAAQAIFDRYTDQLLRLVEARLSRRMRRRVDADDVVQSVMRTFFRHAKRGRYSLDRRGDLWRLLAAITVNKVKRQVEFHSRKKRTADQERNDFRGDGMLSPDSSVFAREPSPEEAASICEECENLLAQLKPGERTILELRLQGAEVSEISEEMRRSERTVRRALLKARIHLQHRLSKDRASRAQL